MLPPEARNRTPCPCASSSLLTATNVLTISGDGILLPDTRNRRPVRCARALMGNKPAAINGCISLQKQRFS
jgi:hypothetical protein